MRGRKSQANVKDAVIGFSWKVSSSAAAQKNLAERAIEQANAEFSNLLKPPDLLPQSASVVLSGVENIKSAAEIWGPLLKNVNTVLQVVDKIAEVRQSPNLLAHLIR